VGHGSFDLPLWQEVFRNFDIDHTGAALEVRHAYLDLRVLRFMLQLPALPWCRVKYVMRQVARGRLPETVRCRPKRALADDAFPVSKLPPAGADDPAKKALARYVAMIGPTGTARESSGSHWVDVRPDALAAWLRQPGVGR
jgi:hypothetical protein